MLLHCGDTVTVLRIYLTRLTLTVRKTSAFLPDSEGWKHFQQCEKPEKYCTDIYRKRYP